MKKESQQFIASAAGIERNLGTIHFACHFFFCQKTPIAVVFGSLNSAGCRSPAAVEKFCGRTGIYKEFPRFSLDIKRQLAVLLLLWIIYDCAGKLALFWQAGKQSFIAGIILKIIKTARHQKQGGRNGNPPIIPQDKPATNKKTAGISENKTESPRLAKITPERKANTLTKNARCRGMSLSIKILIRPIFILGFFSLNDLRRQVR